MRTYQAKNTHLCIGLEEAQEVGEAFRKNGRQGGKFQWHKVPKTGFSHVTNVFWSQVEDDQVMEVFEPLNHEASVLKIFWATLAALRLRPEATTTLKFATLKEVFVLAITLFWLIEKVWWCMTMENSCKLLCQIMSNWMLIFIPKPQTRGKQCVTSPTRNMQSFPKQNVWGNSSNPSFVKCIISCMHSLLCLYQSKRSVDEPKHLKHSNCQKRKYAQSQKKLNP